MKAYAIIARRRLERVDARSARSFPAASSRSASPSRSLLIDSGANPKAVQEGVRFRLGVELWVSGVLKRFRAKENAPWGRGVLRYYREERYVCVVYGRAVG